MDLWTRAACTMPNGRGHWMRLVERPGFGIVLCQWILIIVGAVCGAASNGLLFYIIGALRVTFLLERDYCNKCVELWLCIVIGFC